MNLSAHFNTLNPKEIFTRDSNFVEFDGPNAAEASEMLDTVLGWLEELSSTAAWKQLTWHALGSIESQLSGLVSATSQLKNQWDQSSWQSFAVQLDGFQYHLRSFGVPTLLGDQGRIESIKRELAAELLAVTRLNQEAQKVKEEVNRLIEPAVAGSLSQAFAARKNILLFGRLIWGCIALAVGVYCISATYDFATAIGQAMGTHVPGEVSSSRVWLSVLIRSAVLLPLYAAFGFSFAQYKKERDFEEEYAHKAAVAASLPNYGDLTREPAVRDQIVTGATNVIFSVPTGRNSAPEKTENVMGGLKDVLDAMAKLIPKKE